MKLTLKKIITLKLNAMYNLSTLVVVFA